MAQLKGIPGLLLCQRRKSSFTFAVCLVPKVDAVHHYLRRRKHNLHRRSVNWTKFRPQNFVLLHHLVQRGFQNFSVDSFCPTQTVRNVLSRVARM
jgi:hypothetical protein